MQGADAIGELLAANLFFRIKCPAGGDFDVPETTDLLILGELLPLQRAVLSFWLRRQARGETPLVLTDELTKNIIRAKVKRPKRTGGSNLRSSNEALRTDAYGWFDRGLPEARTPATA